MKEQKICPLAVLCLVTVSLKESASFIIQYTYDTVIYLLWIQQFLLSGKSKRQFWEKKSCTCTKPIPQMSQDHGPKSELQPVLWVNCTTTPYSRPVCVFMAPSLTERINHIYVFCFVLSQKIFLFKKKKRKLLPFNNFYLFLLTHLTHIVITWYYKFRPICQ